MFSVDFTTLEQIMHQFKHTGIFRAYVARSRFSLEEGNVELQVYEGNIIACRFVTRQGVAYKWDDWEKRLSRLGVLNWEQISSRTVMPPLIPSETSPAQNARLPGAVNNRLATPYHSPLSNPSQTRLMPMPYRQVYLLIDGKRQLFEIAAMLRRPEQEVGRIIDELARQGFVLFR